jgi:phosphatidylglycerophosphatase A
VRRVVVAVATWFGTGFSPFAPGTVGTVGAIPLYLAVARLPLPLYLALLALFIPASCLVAGKAQEIFGEKDPGKIVIDEVAGYLVTMTAVPLSWQGVLAGFFLFRLFDVTKPPPARQLDRSLGGGAGVVLDDVAAGIYACITLHLILRFA